MAERPARGGSDIIHELMLSAERQPEELRLTCGKMTVEPNMANVIPGRIQFSVDIRHPEEDVLATFHQKLVSIVENISRKERSQARY